MEASLDELATGAPIGAAAPIGVSAALGAAGLLAVAADPVRWRLLSYLSVAGATCVCDLQPMAAVAGNLLSYHLRILREAGLVHAERRGRSVYYQVTDDALDRLHAALPGQPTGGPQ